MPETQNIEYKSSWRDEFLREICGFANAQGGILFIGKDDKGNVVGVKNAEKLLEDLPNKITTILGIICDVNLYWNISSCHLKLLNISKPTATRLLKQSEKWLKKQGERGQGTNYVIKWRGLIGS